MKASSLHVLFPMAKLQLKHLQSLKMHKSVQLKLFIYKMCLLSHNIVRSGQQIPHLFLMKNFQEILKSPGCYVFLKLVIVCVK